MGFSCASKMLPRVLGRLGSQLKWEILGLDAPVTECGLRQVNLQSINLKKKGEFRLASHVPELKIASTT